MNKKCESKGYQRSLFPISKKSPAIDIAGVLREPQAEAIPLILKSLRKGKNVLFSGSPGFGKTKVAVIVANWIRKNLKGRLVLIASPTLGINAGFKSENSAVYDKKYRVTAKYMHEVECEGEGKIDYLINVLDSYNYDEEQIYIVSHLTLVFVYNRLKETNRLDLLAKLFVIFDEGHHSEIDGNYLGKLLKELDSHRGARYLLTTATPYRSDGSSIIPNEDKCDHYDFDYYKLLHEYKVPYVANQTIGLICYDYVKPEDINKIELLQKRTEENRYCTSFSKWIKAIIKQYKSNPVKTLIIAPNRFIRGEMSFAEISVAIEKAFHKEFPNKVICNLGGTETESGEAELTSSTPKAKVYYKELKAIPDKYDIVISVMTMNEGIDWNCCRQTFICGITRNIRLFIQRDIGRGSRKKMKKNSHSLWYFIAGIDNNEDSEEFRKAMHNVEKNLVFFESLLILNGAFVEFVKRHSIPLPKFFKNPKKEKEVTEEARVAFMTAHYEAQREKEMGGEKWMPEDTFEFIKDTHILDDFTEGAKTDLFINLHKENAVEIISATKKAVKKFNRLAIKNSAFDVWYDIYVKEIGKIKFNKILTNGQLKINLLLTKKLKMKNLKSVWTRYSREFNKLLTEREINELRSVANEQI